MAATSNTGSRPGKTTFWICAGIFALALAARLFYLYEVSKSPTFLVPIIDSDTYDKLARLLIEEGVMNQKFFWQGFFYPLFLSGIYLLTGGSIVLAKIIQILLGSILCVLVYKLARDTFDLRTGVLAGVITALYGPLIFFECELLATSWASFWSVAMILILLKAAGGKSPWIYLAAGLCGGLSTITRATFLPFFAASCIWLAFAMRRASIKRKTIATRESFVVAGFLMIILPVAALCFHTTGQFSFLPQSGPINLYIGNNPETSKTLMIRPGAEWRNLTRLPMVSGSESEDEDRRFFMNRFLNYVAAEPGRYIEGLAHKAIQFVSSRELPRNVDVYLSRRYSKFFSVITWKAYGFGFPFGALMPLAVLGLIRCRRRIPAPVLLFLLLYPSAIILVFVTSRYRTPVIPVLAIPAAAGFWSIVEMLKAKRRFRGASTTGPAQAAKAGGKPTARSEKTARGGGTPPSGPARPAKTGDKRPARASQQANRSRQYTGAAATVLAVAAVLLLGGLAGPFVTENYNYEAEMHCSLGFVLSGKGRPGEAIYHLSEALRLNPEYGDPHKFLGCILHRRGNPEEAIGHFEKALELNPASEYLIHYYMGAALLDLGKIDQAAEHLERALSGARSAKEDLLMIQINRLLKSEALQRKRIE